MFGVKQFRPYVYGQKFTIITDHKPLTWLFSVKDPGSRLLRWRIKLDEFDYEIQYKSGKTNLNADALSRIKEINLIETTTKYGTFLEQFNSKIIMNTRIKEINGQIANAPKDSIVVIDIPKDKIITNELIQTITREVDLTNINTIIGDIAYIEKDKLICLITKEKDSDVPTYENIYNTLIKLRQFCENNRINKLTIFKNKINYTKDKLNWAQVRVMYRYIFKNTPINVLIYSETVMSNQDKLDIIKLYHDSLLGGHLGVTKTLKRIRTQIQWKGMRKDVRQYIEKCESCQKNKNSKNIKLPMAITTTSTKPFQKIFLDIVGKLPTSYRNNSYILTIQDDLTKFLLTIPLEDHTANTMAKAFVTNFVCIHGIPMSILTDNGPEFVGEIFTEVCKILKIKKMMSSVYRPQTNGGFERAHKVIKEMLRLTIDNHAQNWCEHLPFVTFAYNSAVHKSTSYVRKYELLYGNPVELPSPLQRRTERCYTYDNYAYEMKQKMQNAYGLARELLIKTKHKTKDYYDREQNEQNIHVGDKTVHNNIFSLSAEEKLELIFQKVKFFRSQSNKFKVAFKQNNNLSAASFSVSHCIAQHGKPLSDGEYLKEVFVKASNILFHDFTNKNEIIKRINNLPVSRNTVKDRIICMSNDITDQLQTDLASENYFSICLDESTDVTSQAQLAVFVRFSSVNIMREELIKLMTISTKTTGQDIMNVVLKEFANLKINMNNIVSITTDGAPNMVGKHNGFVQLFSKEISHPLISFHCLIHQEALCAKEDSLKSLQNVMEVVTKVVNFITSRALNNRQFTKLLDEVESQYAGLLMYNNVRWLSCGQVLHRFVELLEEIRLFLFEKSQDYPELKDLNWLNDLMFFTDFTTMYN
ncbi:hypothetical protein QTP88_000991 [Uroleucon formosanum]